MRKPPTGFRSLSFHTCAAPSLSVKHPKKPRTNLNSSNNAVLSKIESVSATQFGSIDAVNSLVRLYEGVQNIPRKPLTCSPPNSLSLRKNTTNRELVYSDINERLKGYSRMLRICASEGFLNDGKAVHGQVIKNGIDPDSHLWNSLAFAYAKCGSFRCARQIIDDMPERDVVSWTVLISGLIAEGYSTDGMNLYCEMRKDGIRPNSFTLATCLKACSMRLEFNFGAQLHAEVMKIGELDVFVGSALVDLYAKCDEMELADRVFFYMPERNVVSWNALLNGYAELGDGKEVMKLYSRMTESEMKFSKFTLSTVLKSCANSGNLRNARVVHSLGIKIGSELYEFLGCCLLDMYSKFGLADDALKVFRSIKDPNIVTWSAMINCLDQQGLSQEAAEMFCQMRHAGLRPNQFTFASIVNVATNLCDWCYGEGIHGFIIKYGLESDNFISNALITMHIKFGSIENGWLVFNAMTFRDLASWNALLSGLHDNESCDQGPRIFNHMLVEGFKPDIYTFISILGSCASLLNLGFGKQVHAHIVKNGFEGNGSVGTRLIDLYFKGRCLEDAGIIFNRLIERDIFTWTVVIAGYAQADQGEKAVSCFSQMRQEGLKPNEFTLSSCLNGCSGLAMLENGRQFHSLAIKSGLSGDMYVASTLVDMYGKCQCIGDAEAVFKGMTSRSRFLWNAIICGYSQNGQENKALEAYGNMIDEGILPDELSFVGVLSACSHMGLVEEGKKHFDSLSKVYWVTPTSQICACMVNVLSRAGKFSEVETFVEKMKLTQNALIWETILWACKVHGNVEFGERAAEKLFELEPEIDYNYILLSHIFAARGRWDDVAKVRALMSSRGIKKEPALSWVELNAHAHVFYPQDTSHPDIREICQQLGRPAQ